MWQALAWNDVIQGLLKPLVFAVVISLIGCYLRAAHHRRHAGRGPLHHAGGGRRHRCMIFVLDLMLTKIFVSQAAS